MQLVTAATFRAGLSSRAVSLAAAALIVLACLPVFLSPASRLTSDESLYSAEALNIANGKGLTYTTGDPITHRAPLFPALLAAELRIGGPTLASARWLPRLAIVANSLLTLLLARALFGNAAGVVAGLAAALSPYLNGLGTTLFLDGLEGTFILASLYALVAAEHRQSWRLHAAAGGLLGLAFLTKETAVLFLPLPLLLGLLMSRRAGWRSGLVAWAAGFVAISGWWWAWVYAKQDAVFLLGSTHDPMVQRMLLAGLPLTVLCPALIWSLGPGGEDRPRRRLQGLGLALLAAWVGIFFYSLIRVSWDHPSDYVRSVPSYLRDVFGPAVQPAVIVAAAWLFGFFRTVRGDRASAVLVIGLALFSPFLVVVADRSLSLRDLLPVVYLSYVALGGATASLLRWGEKLTREQQALWACAAGVVAIVAVAAVVAGREGGRVYQEPVPDLQSNWDNEMARATADWLSANVAPGTPVMSSRLYYSQVYFLTGGRYPIAQLPTVEARVQTGALALTRRSTLFRFEPTLLPKNSPADHWLYLSRYPEKGYYVGLAEDDLISDMRMRGTRYLVLNATDAGFSSPSLVSYFDANPAFRLVYENDVSGIDSTRIYEVNLEGLGPIAHPASVTVSAYESLRVRFTDPTALSAWLGRLNPSGAVITPY